MYVLVAWSHPTHCNPMGCSPPGSSVHGILQARILQQLAMPFSRGSSQSRDWTWVSHIAGIPFMVWVPRETLGICYLPLTRIESYATSASDLQHLLKGVQGGEQKWDTVLWKIWQDRSSERYSQGLILWTQFLHLLISRKALNSFMVTPAPCD